MQKWSLPLAPSPAGPHTPVAVTVAVTILPAPPPVLWSFYNTQPCTRTFLCLKCPSLFVPPCKLLLPLPDPAPLPFSGKSSRLPSQPSQARSGASLPSALSFLFPNMERFCHSVLPRPPGRPPPLSRLRPRGGQGQCLTLDESRPLAQGAGSVSVLVTSHGALTRLLHPLVPQHPHLQTGGVLGQAARSRAQGRCVYKSYLLRGAGGRIGWRKKLS